jgi:Raf kinase inhibitor-like YbhB/YbcL family protein
MNPTRATGMTLTGRAFSDGQALRRTCTADGADTSPALKWSQAPAGTKSFALICRDVSAPGGTFIHWVMYNIPATAHGVPEGLPRKKNLTDGSIQGTNDFDVIGYRGPNPPSGRTHDYHFVLYALDTMLPVETGVSATRLLELTKDHVLATARLMGTYRR